MATFPPTPGFIKSLDPANPIGTDFVYGGDDWIQFIQQVLDNQFPTSEDGTANGWDIALTVKASEVNALQGISSTDQIITFPSGTKMLFYQDSAPTGWTIDQTVDDHMVRLTKGSVALGLAGGTLRGTNLFSAQFAVLAEGATPGVGNHTLTGAESGAAAHTHPNTSHRHTVLTGFTLGGGNAWSKVDVSTVNASGSSIYTDLSTGGNSLLLNTVISTPESTAASATTAHGHTVDLDAAHAMVIIATKD